MRYGAGEFRRGAGSKGWNPGRSYRSCRGLCSWYDRNCALSELPKDQKLLEAIRKWWPEIPSEDRENETEIDLNYVNQYPFFYGGEAYRLLVNVLKQDSSLDYVSVIRANTGSLMETAIPWNHTSCWGELISVEDCEVPALLEPLSHDLYKKEDALKLARSVHFKEEAFTP